MTEPIESDHELGRVVEDVVGAAIVDRVWVLFLDRERRVLPTLLPVDGFRLGDPLTNGEVRALIRVADGVAATIDAAEAVVVWERVGGRRLLAGERVLVDRLTALFPLDGLVLRAQFLSHPLGVLKL
jgi:hypothetical protein